MGFLDKAKATAADAADKHGDKIDRGLDKAGDLADQRTQGKHSDKIAQAKTKAADALDNLNGKNDPPTPGTKPDNTGTPPPVR